MTRARFVMMERAHAQTSALPRPRFPARFRLRRLDASHGGDNVARRRHAAVVVRLGVQGRARERLAARSSISRPTQIAAKSTELLALAVAGAQPGASRRLHHLLDDGADGAPLHQGRHDQPRLLRAVPAVVGEEAARRVRRRRRLGQPGQRRSAGAVRRRRRSRCGRTTATSGAASDDADCKPDGTETQTLPTKCWTQGEPPAAAATAKKYKLPTGTWLSTKSIKQHITTSTPRWCSASTSSTRRGTTACRRCRSPRTICKMGIVRMPERRRRDREPQAARGTRHPYRRLG